MYKVGDRVNWKCNNYKNLWQNCEVIEVYDRHVTVLNSAGSRGRLCKQGIELVKEEPKMFEVGKEYKRIGGYNDIAKVLLISGNGVCLEWQREKRLFTLDQKCFSDGWTEYVEPKVYTKEMTVCFSPGKDLYTEGDLNIIGKIRITYTEGSGISVEVLEGDDTGTI